MKKEDMRKKTCCFTGHRNIPPKEYESVKIRLREAIISAIKNGYRYFGAGGALGFDTLAAKTVLELKKQSGGTAYTVQYAQTLELNIVNIAL